jgi:two-component system, cell cycle response regulator
MMVSTATARPTPEPLRVIVADDDPDIREILGDIVRRLGHSCQVASDGSEAWAMHQANRADLILSDWQMPKLDGLQLCQRVREGDSALCRTHFIVVSGRTEKRYLVEGLHAGADEFITKPLDLEELEARLEAAVRMVSVHAAPATIAPQFDSVCECRAARTDPLTAASNQQRLREDLAPLEALAARYGHRYCAALCEVDEFEAYRDRFGPMSRDGALCLVARTIQKHLRSGDSLYRYGSEAFLAILPEQSPAQWVAGFDRIKGDVERLCVPVTPGARAPFLTMSAGIAGLGGGSVDGWLRRADAALFRAKSLGRNRIERDDAALAPPLRHANELGMPITRS